jgi:hypothetical protein
MYMTLWMNKSNHNRQDNIKHRTHRIKEHIKRGHGKPMCPSFTLSCPVGLRSTIPCVICFSLSCPLVMCSCIICVLGCFIFRVHSDWFFSFDVSYNFMSTPKVFFYPVCPMFYSFLSLGIVLVHRICHMLYIVMSTRDVL